MGAGRFATCKNNEENENVLFNLNIYRTVWCRVFKVDGNEIVT